VESRDAKGGKVVRRYRLQLALAVVLGLIAGIAIWSGVKSYLPHKPYYPFIPNVVSIRIPSHDDGLSANAPKMSSLDTVSIPVVSYHQMDNGCAPSAPECGLTGPGEDSVSQQQFYDQMSWLHAHGYHTITAPEYTRWALGQKVELPSHPILLTVDDGIANFYGPATPVLRHFGYNMVAMIVSGFADRASSGSHFFVGWDATWTQLRNLDPAVWSFAFHAGWLGHLPLADSTCPYYYACQRPGESAVAYKTRVERDINNGARTVQRELGSRADVQMWAVPFNDLAQTPTEPQSGSTPRAWLDNYAQEHFKVVFVDGYTTTKNQHYRYEVHGTDSLSYFAQQIERSPVFVRFPGKATAYARAGGQS
jgi:hypothetical protein